MQDQSLKLRVPLLAFVLLTAVDATSIIFAVPFITADLGGNATQGYWIGASYLLATCVSVPLTSHFSDSFERKNMALSSILLLGLGSLLGDYAENMGMLLTGRSMQGLGAGGLIMLAYIIYGNIDPPQSATRFLRALTCSIAVGTVSGPFIGAVLSDGGLWRWAFRTNVFLCVALGLVVYNSGNTVKHGAVTIPCPDYLGASLFVGSVVPVLVGLSLASSVYQWTSWQAILPMVFGSISLLLFVCRELHPNFPSLTLRRVTSNERMLLGLRDFSGADAISTFVGALMLGFVMYALLFFLPIYFLVIKQHSRVQTALLLLPQTIPILPCAFMVLALVDWHMPPGRVVLLGWLCTSCGVGLLSALDADKAVPFDVLLNLLSGFGIGILLPSLTISARSTIANDKTLQAQTLLVSLRYLGNALGLVLVGIAFQLVLERSLLSTKFESRAADMTKHATTLVYSVRKMRDAEDVKIMTKAIQGTLEKIWIALAFACLAVFLFSCAMALVTSRCRHRKALCSSSAVANPHSHPVPC